MTNKPFRHNKRSTLAHCIALALLLNASAGFAQAGADDAVPKAKALVESKSAEQAFKLLAPLESTRAGEPEFDYWLGVAAFESNRLERASLAFERALTVNPDFDAARIELGRTLLRLRSYDLAEKEFQRLLTRPLAPEIKKTLEEYLNAITKARAKERLAVNTFVELGGGRDSNLSSTTNDFTGAVLNSFGLAGIAPTGNSIKRSDNYAAVGAGLDVTNRYREDRTLFGMITARGRFYGQETDYNYASVDAMGGHEWRLGERSLSWTGFVQSYKQKGAFDQAAGVARVTNDRNVFGTGLDLRMAVSETSILNIGLQGAAVRYRTNESQDTNQATIAATWQTMPSAWEGGSFAATTFYTKDRARKSLNLALDTDVSRRSYGIRLGVQSNPRDVVAWSLSTGWVRREDEKAFARAALVEFGRDELSDVSLKLAWRFYGEWTLQPYLNAMRNRSNIALYTFNKLDGGFMIRRDFK